MKGWLKAVATVAAIIGSIAVLGAIRAERQRDPVPTQRDLRLQQGVPVEVAPVEQRALLRRIRLFGTVAGERQAEVIVTTPNILQRVRVAVGDEVRAGQQVASMRDTALSPLGFRYTPLKAQHEAAQADLARVQALHAEGGVTDQQLEHARAMADAAAADYEAAVASIHITAPVSGTVTRIDFRPGEMVPNDRPLMQIAAIDTVVVDLMAESSDVALIAEGQEVAVTAAALPGRTFTGRVVERSMGSYPVINQFRVRIAIPNPDRLLLPGYPVQAEVLVRSDDGGLVVPRSAIVDHDGQPVVWAVGDDGTARMVPVTPGFADDRHQVVSGDLASTDRVVSLGAERVPADGARLIVIDEG